MVATYQPLPRGLGNIFTATEAAQRGVGRGRLRAPDVEREFPGVYAVKGTGLLKGDEQMEDLHVNELWKRHQLQRVAVFCRVMKPQLLFGGRTAAAILGLPVPPRPLPTGIVQGDVPKRLKHLDCRIEVVSLVPANPPRLRAVKPRRLRSHLVTTRQHDGKRVMTPTTTWVTLANELSLRDLVALGDAIIRQDRIPDTTRLAKRPHSTLGALRQEFGRGLRAGAQNATVALSLLSPHSASPPESHLRLLLREWGLPTPELDYDVCDSSGVFLGCSEFAFPELKVVIEYEGDHHRVEKNQWDRDIEKGHKYAAAGWVTIRVTARHLYAHPWELREKITLILRQRGWSMT